MLSGHVQFANSRCELVAFLPVKEQLSHLFAAPLINPNLLSTPTDRAIMRAAIRSARAFVSAPAWSGYILNEFGPSAAAHTDAELDAYARDNADTIDHPVGTVPMGAGDGGALHSDLRVKGTVGLRIVDASAFVSI